MSHFGLQEENTVAQFSFPCEDKNLVKERRVNYAKFIAPSLLPKFFQAF